MCKCVTLVPPWQGLNFAVQVYDLGVTLERRVTLAYMVQVCNLDAILAHRLRMVLTSLEWADASKPKELAKAGLYYT